MRYLPFLSFVGAVAVLTACASDAPECPAPTVAITDSAVVAFIDSVEPTPRRFLIATGDYGDSALTDAAANALRGEGPTYMFPSDTVVNRPVRNRLIAAGPTPVLLVFYHGMQTHGDTAVDVTFSGRFVTGAWDGNVAPRKSVRMVCGPNDTWQVAKPAPADTTGAAE